MHNYFAIETEADHRRREWERAALAESLIAQNHATRPRANRSGWALAGFASLRSFIAPWLPLAAIVPTRCRVATC